MNLIVNNQDNFVLIQIESEITSQNGVYFIDGISTGISIEENTLVSDAISCPYFEFASDVYSYIDGAWGIYNQNSYNAIVYKYNQEQKQKREEAYKLESDPINFLMQREEATKEDWLNKIAEIKARYPYQE